MVDGNVHAPRIIRNPYKKGPAASLTSKSHSTVDDNMGTQSQNRNKHTKRLRKDSQYQRRHAAAAAAAAAAASANTQPPSKRQKGGQLDLFGNVAFNPLEDCQTCRAQHHNRTNPFVPMSVSHKGHHQ